MSNKSIFKSSGIEPIKYNGAVDNFRAWMDKFLIHASDVAYLEMTPEEQKEMRKIAFEEQKGHGDINQSTYYYPHLLISYSLKDKDSNREVWYVLLYEPKVSRDSTRKWATILAVEEPPNHTVVQFLDGIYFRLIRQDGTIGDYVRGLGIGEKFSEYAQLVKDEWAKKYDDKEGTKKVEVIIEGGENIRESLMSINEGMANIFSSFSSELMQEVLGSIKEIDLSPLFESNREMLAGIAASFSELAQQSFLGLADHQKNYIYPKILEISDGLDEVEDAIEVITPEALDESLPEIGEGEKQTILDSQKAIMDELTKIRTEIENLKTSIATRSKMEKPTKSRGANRATRDKIRRLAEHRQQAIDERGSVPGWIYTCQEVVHIDSRIAAKYAPELSEKWDDRSFRWKGFDYDD